MKRVFASSVQCLNAFADKPEIFLLEIDDAFRAYLSECWRAVQNLERKFGQQFESATFVCSGIWADSFELAENVLDNNEFVWLDEMPQASDMNAVLGHQMKIFTDGSIVFRAYDDANGDEFVTALLGIEDVVANPLVDTLA